MIEYDTVFTVKGDCTEDFAVKNVMLMGIYILLVGGLEHFLFSHILGF